MAGSWPVPPCSDKEELLPEDQLSMDSEEDPKGNQA